jgi:hypothetical protein
MEVEMSKEKNQTAQKWLNIRCKALKKMTW